MQKFLQHTQAECTTRLLTDESGAGPVEEELPCLSLAELRAKAREIFAERLNGARTKYKDLLRPVHDALGAVTLARPHGGKDSVSTRVARSFLERMTKGLIASLAGGAVATNEDQ